MTLLNSNYLLFWTLANLKYLWFDKYEWGLPVRVRLDWNTDTMDFNHNLYKFSDKFLCAFSMRLFVLWVDTILLNWIQWILLFPILSDSIFVIFITHRLLTLPTPCLTRQLRHSWLEPKNTGSSDECDALIPITLHGDTDFILIPTLLAGIIPLPDHTQPKYIGLESVPDQGNTETIWFMILRGSPSCDLSFDLNTSEWGHHPVLWPVSTLLDFISIQFNGF